MGLCVYTAYAHTATCVLLCVWHAMSCMQCLVIGENTCHVQLTRLLALCIKVAHTVCETLMQ